jgi:hypothetical protein
MTFRAAPRHDRITAPGAVDGLVNGELFCLYGAKILVPALNPDGIVVLANSSPAGGVRRALLNSPKSQAVRAAIQAGQGSFSGRP